MSQIAETEFGQIMRATVQENGRKDIFILTCPGCSVRAYLDDDQYHGRVSVDHAADGCTGGYHETHDFADAVERSGGFKDV